MRKIIYYVATSVDGFIAGPNGDVSSFIYEGEAVNTYLEDLKKFKHVLMGRTTYEFGYQFGVEPGQPSPTYAHMMQYVVSDHLTFESTHPQVKVIPLEKEVFEHLKKESDSDFYLCGGGQLAGWLLNQGLVDEIKLKVNPILVGSGIKLFENVNKAFVLQILDEKRFEKDMRIMHYSIQYT